jgi:hypothetical protein
MAHCTNLLSCWAASFFAENPVSGARNSALLMFLVLVLSLLLPPLPSPLITPELPSSNPASLTCKDGNDGDGVGIVSTLVAAADWCIK